MIIRVLKAIRYDVQTVPSEPVRWSCDTTGVAIVLKVLTDTNSSGETVHMHVAGSMAKSVPGPGGQATGVQQT